jgi:hypothetical protein
MVTIYSCTFSSYDFDFGPFAATTGARMLRFTDTPEIRRGLWERLAVPEEAARQPSQALINRYMKFFPMRFFAGSEVAVYVDGNILIKADLSPLLDEFRHSGADMALFPHPSGRTLDEEIDFAMRHRMKPDQRPLAEEQRARYHALGLLDHPITENSIIFYRLGSNVLPAFAEAWWQELQTYSHRDQISLPFALHEVPLAVHSWDWHFKETPNPYFDRYPHRYGSPHKQRRIAAEFLGKYRLHQRLLSYAIHPPKIIESIRKRVPPIGGDA